MARKQKYDYFKGFVEQVDIAVDEANLLIETIENFTTADNLKDTLERVHEMEHKADMISHATFTAIAVDFITPIDREDLIELTQRLDDIVDSIEDVFQHFYMMDIHFMHHDALEMAQLIKKNCTALREAMAEFKDFRKSKRFKEAIVDVNTFEEEADNLYIALTRKLHVNDADNPLRVLVWSRIFTKMEKCNDACEHAADTMATILLKHA